jgi:hypothetical protein
VWIIIFNFKNQDAARLINWSQEKVNIRKSHVKRDHSCNTYHAIEQHSDICYKWTSIRLSWFYWLQITRVSILFRHIRWRAHATSRRGRYPLLMDNTRVKYSVKKSWLVPRRAPLDASVQLELEPDDD